MAARRHIDTRQLGFDFEPANDVVLTATTVTRRPARMHIIRIGDETLTTTQASQRYGIPRQRLCARLREGWSHIDAVTVPAWVHHERVAIPAGHPSSASWDRDPWEDDDHAWYVVAHHPDGLSLEQIAALMGVTDERVRQIEQEGLAVLRELLTDPTRERPQWVIDVIGKVAGLMGDGDDGEDDCDDE